MKMGRAALALGLAGLAAYIYWRSTGRAVQDSLSDYELDAAEEFGKDGGAGNLLGVQAHMVTGDYAHENRFYAKLDGYLSAASQRGWLGPKTIAVFPEYIGTWLATAHEKRRVYSAGSLGMAMLPIAACHPLRFAYHVARAGTADRLAYSVFRTKASDMARTYDSAFARLASKYRIHIVAGSIVLPAPRVENGRLRAGHGPLYNVSLLYRPDGSADEQVVRKAYPVPRELGFTTPGSIADLPVYDTPAGKLAVLICADAWYPEAYAAVKAKGAELVAVPSYVEEEGAWDKPWGGYMLTTPPPADYDPATAQQLTEGEAWLKFAMPGRLGPAGIANGINVFLRGELWGMGSDGHTLMVRAGEVLQGRHVRGAALANMWL